MGEEESGRGHFSCLFSVQVKPNKDQREICH